MPRCVDSINVVSQIEGNIQDNAEGVEWWQPLLDRWWPLAAPIEGWVVPERKQAFSPSDIGGFISPIWGFPQVILVAISHSPSRLKTAVFGGPKRDPWIWPKGGKNRIQSHLLVHVPPCLSITNCPFAKKTVGENATMLQNGAFGACERPLFSALLVGRTAPQNGRFRWLKNGFRFRISS